MYTCPPQKTGYVWIIDSIKDGCNHADATQHSRWESSLSIFWCFESGRGKHPSQSTFIGWQQVVYESFRTLRAATVYNMNIMVVYWGEERREWKAKRSFYRSIFGHKLWVVTQKMRWWIQEAEISFLRRLSGLSLRPLLCILPALGFTSVRLGWSDVNFVTRQWMCADVRWRAFLSFVMAWILIWRTYRLQEDFKEV